MAENYAESKIKEALQLNSGNLTLARQQIISWASKDQKLLYALCRPHLSGIIAYQIERVASGRADREREIVPTIREKNIENSHYKEEDFGMDLLRAVASSDAAIFGQDGSVSGIRKGAASKQHIDAIRQMASRATVKPNSKK
jgi:hypothetical protein